MYSYLFQAFHYSRQIELHSSRKDNIKASFSIHSSSAFLPHERWYSWISSAWSTGTEWVEGACPNPWNSAKEQEVWNQFLKEPLTGHMVTWVFISFYCISLIPGTQFSERIYFVSCFCICRHIFVLYSASSVIKCLLLCSSPWLCAPPLAVWAILS